MSRRHSYSKITKFRLLVILCPIAVLIFLQSKLQAQGSPVDQFTASQQMLSTNEFVWSKIGTQQKPWTRWWWPGSTVNKKTIDTLLEQYAKAGLGGVEITPIYGVEGYEDQYIDFLSPQWMDMLRFTAQKAHDLGIGVSMIVGTGWPFGGPQVEKEDAARMVTIQTYQLRAQETLDHRIQEVNKTFQKEAPLVALMAYSENGRTLNLTKKVDSRGKLDWKPQKGVWTLIAFFDNWSTQQVKRAAPGGVGNVLDHFSNEALENYLAPFNSAFKKSDKGLVDVFFNDSYEVYEADWTHDFLNQFSKLQGYDLRSYLPAFLGNFMPSVADSLGLTNKQLVKRVRADYYETISNLALERFAKPWVKWTHSMGGIAKNQAHGFPGNILDIYAAADIPEMEIFGQRKFNIPGLRSNPSLTNQVERPSPLLLKLASSAAHVSGKKLTSSESFTWLDEHFRVALSQIKPHLDMELTAGINHIIYHGTPYSPPEERWPGWLFYASTLFAPANPFWDDFSALNTYIARSQVFMQKGKPDNDILLYFPIYDLWHKTPEQADNYLPVAVGNPGEWFYGTNFESTASYLWDKGFTFDYVSDRQLKKAKLYGSQIQTASNINYTTVIVPKTKYMPLSTFQKLLNYANAGGTVIFKSNLPGNVPGLENLIQRKKRFQKLKNGLSFRPHGSGKIYTATVGKGQVIYGDNLSNILNKAGIQREPIVDYGIDFSRRKDENSYTYFITNLYGQAIDEWIPLNVQAESVVIYNPMNKEYGVANIKKSDDDKTLVHIQIDPGESRILKTSQQNISNTIKPWKYLDLTGPPVPVKGTWTVNFEKGGPVIPESFETTKLASWTELGGKDARRFSGTARYTITFEKPNQKADTWILDLGNVAESATVRLNGKQIETLWSLPFRTDIGSELEEGKNKLEIEVTNLGANRVADMDRRGIHWKKFYDINFVNLDYEPFDASGWEPMDSGLLGPVQLIPYNISK